MDISNPSAARTPAEQARLDEVLRRAEAGDPAVIDVMLAALDADEAMWRQRSDLARQAAASWIDLAAGPNLLLKEALFRSWDALVAELAGPAAPPLERLLAEQVATGRLAVSYHQARLAQARGLTPAQTLLLERQLSEADRRYQRAIRTLADVRRLLPVARPAAAPPPRPRPKARSPRRRTPSGRRLTGAAFWRRRQRRHR